MSLVNNSNYNANVMINTPIIELLKQKNTIGGRNGNNVEYPHEFVPERREQHILTPEPPVPPSTPQQSTPMQVTNQESVSMDELIRQLRIIASRTQENNAISNILY